MNEFEFIVSINETIKQSKDVQKQEIKIHGYQLEK